MGHELIERLREKISKWERELGTDATESQMWCIRESRKALDQFEHHLNGTSPLSPANAKRCDAVLLHTLDTMLADGR